MIIILGMAGAGKSTQCRLLSENMGMQWVAVGQLLRSIDLGERKSEMIAGSVLSDEIVTPLVAAELERRGDTPEILLDGCPRTVGQATWLAGLNYPKVRAVIHMVSQDECSIERLMERGREDDNREAITKRISGYHRDIGPVLAEFKVKGVPVYEIDACQAIDEVYEEISDKIGKL